ncbi:MAG: flagellar hook-associated protein FlgK [Lachnospiraceae bacterium]|nr:flagellar hook-associated protein FlgK [Lachnospiraceae bacterium]
MPSTFFGLEIAASGLRASNAALNTTANNISNTNTEGYSRQEVKQEAMNPLRVFATYGCAGAGVNTLAIERIREQFYDNKFRDNETKLGEYDTKAYYCTMIEDYLNDDGKTGFKSIFDQFAAALQEITKNASSESYKRAFISQAKSLTDYFNNMYGDLQNLQADVNEEIKIRIDHINSIAQDIATVNKQINTIEMSGTIANELRDKRDVLIDELSAIVDVKTEESPIYDQWGNVTGANRYIVRIAGGQTLVDQNDYNQLICEARTSEEKVNQSDVDGLYEVRWTNGTDFGLYNESMHGELKGLIEMRDGNNGEYFNGTASNILYSGKTSQVTIKTTASYLDSMSKCNLTDTGGIINIGDQLYYFTDWSFDKDTGEYTFTIDNEATKAAGFGNALTASKNGRTASVGQGVNYQGVPYYMAQMNEWIRDFAQKVNEIFTDGITDAEEDAGILFTGVYPKGDGQYTEAQLNDSRQNGKGYYYMTAGNVTIEETLMKDASLLGTRGKNEKVGDTDPDEIDGVEQCEQVRKVISMLSDKNQFSFRGRDAGGFLECVLSDAMLNTKNAKTFYSTYLSLEVNIDNQRTSISGVDEDEEAVSLVKYQNSYTLASKMISVLTEIYDRLILQTGV